MTTRSLRNRTWPAACVAVGAVLAFSGCTAAVPMEPAPSATDPGCADVIVHLPDTVADLPSRETNAQATAAWGSPAAILLHCGVEVPGPTTLPCVSVNGVDWIQDDSEAPRYRFTTYGRQPAVELVIDSGAVTGSSVLVDLAPAITYVEATRNCTGVEELLIPSEGGPEGTTGPQAP